MTDNEFLDAVLAAKADTYTHVQYALDHGEITKEEITAYVKARMGEETRELQSLRRAFCPELATTDELVHAAVEVLQRSESPMHERNLPKELLQKLQSKNEIKGDPDSTALVSMRGGWQIGPVMQILEKMFLDACEPQAPYRSDPMWTGRHYRDPYKHENEASAEAHRRRQELRPVLARLMVAVDYETAMLFFLSLGSELKITTKTANGDDELSRLEAKLEHSSMELEAMLHDMRPEDYIKNRAEALGKEMRDAMVVALVAVGGVQLLQSLPVLIDQIMRGERDWMSFGDGKFHQIGKHLLTLVVDGTVDPERVQEVVDAAVKQTVEIHKKKQVGRRFSEHTTPNQDYQSPEIGKIGLLAVAPLVAEVDPYLTIAEIKDLKMCHTLTTLSDALKEVTGNLKILGDKTPACDVQVEQLLTAALSMLEKASSLKQGESRVQESAKNMLRILMQSRHSKELKAVFERNPGLHEAFEAWRKQEIGLPDVDMGKYTDFVKAHTRSLRAQARSSRALKDPKTVKK